MVLCCCSLAYLYPLSSNHLIKINGNEKNEDLYNTFSILVAILTLILTMTLTPNYHLL